MFSRFCKRTLTRKNTSGQRRPQQSFRAFRPFFEQLEVREVPAAFQPGNLVILQAGDGVTAYNAQAPLFLNEITTSGSAVQQVAIAATAGVGLAGNQASTLDASASAGNGQLKRSADGASLIFTGVDSTVNNGGLTSPVTPTGTSDRVVGVLTGDPATSANLDTTTHGQFYVGADSRSAVAASPTGPIYTAGAPSQAGSSSLTQGVRYFATEGASTGTQVSAATDVRSVTIAFDNRMYFATAGSTSLGQAGIYTEAAALPTTANASGSDIQVVGAANGASRIGGFWIADMNGNGILDNGDRLYFVDDGAAGGAGTGGLYASTWNNSTTANAWNTPNNGAAVAAGLVNHWGAAVRLGDAAAQTGSGGVGQLRDLTGTVISSTEAFVYTSAFDNAANDSSFIQKWDDTTGTSPVTPTTVQTLANGMDTIGGRNYAKVGLRGISFAPAAATTVVLTASPGTFPPSTSVTFTASVINPQLIVTGQVVFIDANTSTVLGTGAISSFQATFTTTLVGNHNVQAYFAGGGTLALAPARSNTLVINEAGSTVSTTTLTSNVSTAAVGRAVTFTATVTSGATGTVSFYNGSVGAASLLGTATVSSNTASLTTPFSTAGTPTVIAVYSGNNTLAGSQGSKTVTVAANATATITASANNQPVGSTQTYTVTITGNATLGAPAGTVVFTVTSATTGSVVGTSGSIALTTGTTTGTALWTGPALSTAGSYFVTVAFTPTGATNPYGAFAVNTTSSANGVAFIETAKQAFAPGNLVVVQRGDGSANLGGSAYVVLLDEYTPAGTLVQKIALPNLGSGTTGASSFHAVLLGGQEVGLLNRSNNGIYLTLAGYNASVGQQFIDSSYPSQLGRTIARIDGSGNVDTSTVVSAAATISVPYNPVSVISNTGSQFWIVGNLPTSDTTENAIDFVSALSGTTATQIGPANSAGSGIAIAGNQLYVTKGSGDVQAVGSGLPTTTGQTLTGLTGLAAAYSGAFPATQNPTQVVLLNTNDGTTNSPNVAYIADTTNGLLKFALSGGSWVFRGQKPLGTAGGVRGVSGSVLSPGGSAQVQLYVSAPSQLATFTDTNLPSSGFSSGSFTPLAAAGSNTSLAGVSFAPGNITSTTLTDTGATSPNLYTATVTTLGGNVPTGVVIFSRDGTVVGTGTLNGSGVAAFSDAAYPASGTHTISAAYQGDVKDGTSTGTLVQGPAAFGAGDLLVDQVGTAASASIGSGGITETTTTATVTTTAAHGFVSGQAVIITGTSVAGYNNIVFTITVTSTTKFTFTATAGLGTSNNGTAALAAGNTNGTAAAIVEYTTAGSSVQTVSLPSTGSSAFTLTGSTATEGYVTRSADTHSTAIAGYNVAVGSSTAGGVTGASREIGVINANGSIETSTQLSAVDAGTVRAVVSADGLGFWVATNNGLRYVPFGNSALTSTVQVSNEFTSPNTVGIGSKNPDTATPTPGQLFASAGAGANAATGAPALDSPFTVGSSLPTVGGQLVAVSPSFPTATDGLGSFPTTAQFVISPDGNTMYLADSRTDSKGGILKYFQATTNSWTLVDKLQLNSFSIADAKETGTTVTITTSAPYTFLSGITGGGLGLGTGVQIAGVATGFNGTFLLTSTPDNTHFTYTASSSGLAEVMNTGFATSTDGGIRGLAADFSGANPVLYATTSATTGNRLVKLADGGDLLGNAGGFTPTTLATAAGNTAFRGVALDPPPGSTPSTTALSVTGSPGSYPSGVTLSATVTGAGATGYVSFRQNGVEIGVAALVSGTATLTPSADLLAGSYTSLVAVYTGDPTYAPSTSSPVQSASVTKASTTTALTASATTLSTGVADTLTASLTGLPTGVAPSGTVTFWDGTVGTGTNLGTVNLAQVIVNQAGSPVITFTATLSTTFTTQATHNMSAVYSGDSNFSGSTGTVSILVVNPSTTVVTTNKTNPTASPSVSVSFTATVSGSAGTPTGSVQFYNELLPIGSPLTLSGGAATVSVTTGLLESGTNLVPGLQSISAIYTPDGPASTVYATSTGVYEQAVKPQTLGTTHQFVERVGDGTTNLIAQAPNPSAGAGSIGSTIYIDEIDPTLPSGSNVVQEIVLPVADGTGTQATIHAVVGNGQQSNAGQMSLSGDGRYLFLVGYDNNPLSAATALEVRNVAVSRSVARIDGSGNVQSVAFTAGAAGSGTTSSGGVQTGGNITGVYSPDGSVFYVSGFNGFSYFSSFAPSAAPQNATLNYNNGAFTINGLEPNNGNLVIVEANQANRLGQYTGFPTTSAATASTVPGVNATTDTGNPSAFIIDIYFTHLSGGGAPAGINTFYLSDDGPTFAGGAISKWAFNGTQWNQVDSIISGSGNTLPDTYWLNGITDGSGNVTLYTTYGNGGNANTGPGQLGQIIDTNGYNMPIGTGGTHSDTITIVAAVGSTSNETYRGVASAPTPPPTPIAPPTLTINPFTLPAGQLSTSYSQTLTASGGTAPYTFTVASGTLPPGLALSSSGALSGTPTSSGSFTFMVTALDSLGNTGAQSYSLGVASQFLVTPQLVNNTATAGSSFSVTVQAADASGNSISNFSGSAAISLAPADAQGTTPSSVTLSNGTGMFLETLRTVLASGTYTLTATLGTATGTSPSIAVVAANAIHFTVVPTVANPPDPGVAITGTTTFPVVVTAKDAFNNVATGYTGTMKLTSTDTAATGVGANYTYNGAGDSGAHVFFVTMNTAGSQTLTATDSANLISTTTAPITVRGLIVYSLTTTPTGFVATFSKPVKLLNGAGSGATPLVNLYDSTLKGTVTNPGFIIPGALLFSNNNQTVTFVATNLELPDDTYSLDLTSSGNVAPTGAAVGFQDLNGVPLDGANNAGNADYTPANFATTFSVPLDVSLPGFSRGPGQPVNVDLVNSNNAASTAGIPVQLTDNAASGSYTATSVSFTMSYNANWLTISNVTNVSSPAGGTYSVSTAGSGTSATATFTFTNGGGVTVASGAGPLTIGQFTASVPSAAAYKSKGFLNLGTPTVLNGASLVSSVAQNAVEVVAFLGNASGLGTYSPLDASLMSSFENTGALFPSFPLADPNLIAGVDGSVDPNSVSQVLQFNLNKPVPGIPSDTGLTPPSNNPSGPDPALSIPTGLQVGAGGTVSVPVNIDDPHPAGSTGLVEAMLALTYDPRVFNVSAQDIHLGTVPLSGTGWTLSSTVDPAMGQIAITLYSLTPISAASAGSLVTIDFHVQAGASAGASPVQLVAAVDAGGQELRTALADSQGFLTLHQAPTSAFLPGLDGQIVVTAERSAPATAPEAVQFFALQSDATEKGATNTAPVLPALTGEESDGAETAGALAHATGGMVAPVLFLSGPNAGTIISLGAGAALSLGSLPVASWGAPAAQRLLEQVLVEQAHALSGPAARSSLEAPLWDAAEIGPAWLLDQGQLGLQGRDQNQGMPWQGALPAANDAADADYAALEEYFARAGEDLE